MFKDEYFFFFFLLADWIFSTITPSHEVNNGFE